MEVTGTVERARCWQTVPFVWKIKDFSKILGRGGYLCVSPTFHLCGHTWYLQLYTGDRWDDIVLNLWSEEPHPAAETRYSFGILLASGKTEMEVAGFCSTCEEKCSKSVAMKKIARSEFSRRRAKWLPLDVLTVSATLSPVKGTRDVYVQTGVDGSRGRKRQRTDGKDEQGEKAGSERVLQDIRKMRPSDEQCDVVFKVRGREFKVRREILSDRTPALDAMFRHDAAEKASGVVTIEKCEPEVFEQLLHYAYTGAPREVTAENACPLFTLADKYRVREVKTHCVRFMQNTLCVDTFCKAVTLALTHKEDELLKTAVNFFNRNMLDIVKTFQWQTFLRDHSTLANEILIRALKIKQVKILDGDSSRA